MNSLATDLRTVLATAGIGTADAKTGWAIYIGEEPQRPNTVVALYDYAGQDPSPNLLLDFPNMQARVRGAKGSYEAAWVKAQAVKDALLGYGPATVGGTPYIGIWMNGDINYLGLNEARLPVFTLNFRIVREPASGTYRVAV